MPLKELEKLKELAEKHATEDTEPVAEPEPVSNADVIALYKLHPTLVKMAKAYTAGATLELSEKQVEAFEAYKDKAHRIYLAEITGRVGRYAFHAMAALSSLLALDKTIKNGEEVEEDANGWTRELRVSSFAEHVTAMVNDHGIKLYIEARKGKQN
ncbi:hypothetical protein [Paludifilum halophilum]|uniref:Uncharacterized protein n=1 Tax=Paludifilum halophilum TaxID=1642702 RepID=A0A235B239_9BACL|nr:hypothetical protein [Paludifilum halophilum]OYD06291.1 hypothetical protein CHM34_17150 [Paludifilum halophilum]